MHLLKAAVLDTNMTFLTECRTVLRRLAGGFRRSGSSRVMRNLVHNAVAGLFILFYARNILSSTIRAVLSF